MTTSPVCSFLDGHVIAHTGKREPANGGAGVPWRRLERSIRDSVQRGTPNPYFSRRHMLRKVVLRNTTHMRAHEVRAHWAFILRLQDRRDRLVFKSPSSEHAKWWESDAAEWGDLSDGAEGLGGLGEAGGSIEGRAEEEDEDAESMDSEDDPDVELVGSEDEKDDMKIASQVNCCVGERRLGHWSKILLTTPQQPKQRDRAMKSTTSC